MKITAYISLTVAVALGVSVPAHSDSWLHKMQQFVVVPPARAVSAPRAAGTMVAAGVPAPRVSAMSNGTLYYTPRAAAPDSLYPSEVTINGESIGPAFQRRGVTYVALRTMLDEIGQLDGARYNVSYEGDGRVSVERIAGPTGRATAAPSENALFGEALAALWAGHTKDALSKFDGVTAREGTNAADAKALSTWLRSGLPSADETNKVGIVRFAWWTSRLDTIAVQIDGQTVNQKALLVAAPVGEHTLQIKDADGALLYQHSFMVHSNAAFVVRFDQQQRAQASGTE